MRLYIVRYWFSILYCSIVYHYVGDVEFLGCSPNFGIATNASEDHSWKPYSVLQNKSIRLVILNEIPVLH